MKRFRIAITLILLVAVTPVRADDTCEQASRGYREQLIMVVNQVDAELKRALVARHLATRYYFECLDLKPSYGCGTALRARRAAIQRLGILADQRDMISDVARIAWPVSDLD